MISVVEVTLVCLTQLLVTLAARKIPVLRWISLRAFNGYKVFLQWSLRTARILTTLSWHGAFWAYRKIRRAWSSYWLSRKIDPEVST